jgi:hypothetical protein
MLSKLKIPACSEPVYAWGEWAPNDVESHLCVSDDRNGVNGRYFFSCAHLDAAVNVEQQNATTFPKWRWLCLCKDNLLGKLSWVVSTQE